MIYIIKLKMNKTLLTIHLKNNTKYINKWLAQDIIYAPELISRTADFVKVQNIMQYDTVEGSLYILDNQFY